MIAAKIEGEQKHVKITKKKMNILVAQDNREHSRDGRTQLKDNKPSFVPELEVFDSSFPVTTDFHPKPFNAEKQRLLDQLKAHRSGHNRLLFGHRVTDKKSGGLHHTRSLMFDGKRT